MSTNSSFDHLARAWLDEGPTQLSDFALDAALAEVQLTRQRRALRVPWRFPTMPALTRATGIAAVALVAVVGVGGLYLASNPGGAGSENTPAPTATPALAQSHRASEVAPGITGWTRDTSQVTGSDLFYPSDWSHLEATRAWQAGDRWPADDMPFVDAFVSPEEGDESIAVFVWRMPAGADLDAESWTSLKGWAQTFCTEVLTRACQTFTEQAVRMNQEERGYGSAIFVPGADHQFAFVANCTSCVLVGAQDSVTVVVVARPDDHPSAARYGGAVQLLRSFLSTIGVEP